MLDQLPLELIIIILTFVRPEDFQKIRQVCRCLWIDVDVMVYEHRKWRLDIGSKNYTPVSAPGITRVYNTQNSSKVQRHQPGLTSRLFSKNSVFWQIKLGHIRHLEVRPTLYGIAKQQHWSREWRTELSHFTGVMHLHVVYDGLENFRQWLNETYPNWTSKELQTQLDRSLKFIRERNILQSAQVEIHVEEQSRETIRIYNFIHQQIPYIKGVLQQRPMTRQSSRWNRRQSSLRDFPKGLGMYK
jgi:hypothetical protein